MVKLLLVTCILVACTLIFVNCEQTLTSTSSDCTTLVYEMTDCISYLTKGGTETKPEPSCCSGYEALVKANAECICVAMNSTANIGIDIDMSKAIKLPSACGDKTPNISCLSSEAPSKPPTPSNPPVHHHHHKAPPPQVPAPAPETPAPAPEKAAATTKMPAFAVIGLAIVPFFFAIVA